MNLFESNRHIEIKVTPVWCKIISENDQDIYDYLYENLSYRPTGYFYSPKYQDGTWDGYSRLFKPTLKKFRLGMLPTVLDLLDKYECTYSYNSLNNVSDKKKLSKFTFRTSDGIEVKLRDYQIEAAETTLNIGFGIIQAPPRAGKTLIAAAIINEVRKYPINFFTRSRDLAYQAKKVFENNFGEVGFICDGVCNIKDNGINIITVQSAFSVYNKKLEGKLFPKEIEVELENKLRVNKLIKNTKCIFYDEAHHSLSTTSRFIFDKSINASLRIGLSATPFSDKEESILVKETIGPVIYQISYSTLIDAGYLMKPYIYLYKLPPMHIEKGETYRGVYKRAVVENEFLNQLIKGLVNKLNSLGKSVVVQTEYISHSKDLANYLECLCLTGREKDSKVREDIKKKLNDKEILCLVSTILEEGADIPTLDYTINLVGGLSNIGAFQKMRSITYHKDKTYVGIIDFMFQCTFLDKHSKKRLTHYQSEPAFSVELRDVSNKTISEIFSNG